MLFRLQPAMPVTAYKTYAYTMPLATHTRPASCAEVECVHWRDGWVTKVDAGTELGVRQARYILDHSGRSFSKHMEGLLLTFTFPAGQECFTAHRVSVHRPPICAVRDGDWRGNPTGRRLVHASERDWVDDFGEHQLRLKERIERG